MSRRLASVLFGASMSLFSFCSPGKSSVGVGCARGSPGIFGKHCYHDPYMGLIPRAHRFLYAYESGTVPATLLGLGE